jgi:oligoribonuclease NrnB/cAMP/cGMP phosphodiesterase (DHH superfamily)
MNNYNYIFHLSHIDLDGYGCQYLTNKVFNDINFYNANYGAEVNERLEQIYSDIEEQKAKDESFKPLILITDLNLTTKEGNQLEKKAVKLGAKLLLLDHHATGANAAERFAWYNLDTTKCATTITYNWLKEFHSFDKENEYKAIVESIEAIDIWVDNSKYFDYGRVLLGMISGAREVNRVVFANEDRAYKFRLIEEAKEVLNKNSLEDAPIILDDKLHFIKKDFFKKSKNDTKDNLVATFVTDILTKNKDTMSIEYKGKRGILTYSTGNTSLIGNNFLVANEDFDFYMDVNSRGGFSLRSNNKVDVSKMAAEIGNGGGHPNASGGKIENYKDSFVYENFKEFVQEYLKQKESENE